MNLVDQIRNALLGQMTVSALIDRLNSLVERDPRINSYPVELMIEIDGQLQAPLNDVALASGKYVVLIYEKPT